MPEQWYVVYWATTGEAHSIGTSLADPMPPKFGVQTLSQADADLLLSVAGAWDAKALSVVATARP